MSDSKVATISGLTATTVHSDVAAGRPGVLRAPMAPTA